MHCLGRCDRIVCSNARILCPISFNERLRIRPNSPFMVDGLWGVPLMSDTKEEAIPISPLVLPSEAPVVYTAVGHPKSNGFVIRGIDGLRL